MNCYYCDKIHATDERYYRRPAEFDLGSEAPRCAWHWRFVCGTCRSPQHFMATAYCPARDGLMCRRCAVRCEEIGEAFWAWHYRYELYCSCGEAHPTLDFAEFSGRHPWQSGEPRWLSKDTWLGRYPDQPLPQMPVDAVTEDDCETNWSANADVWVKGYDERGDRNRKYNSDPVLLSMLGPVQGLRILDAGSGNGYLCRMLARQGATMVGVELSSRFYDLATSQQAEAPLDIRYHRSSIASMPFLEDAQFDAAVANYVLMDVRHYREAIGEIARTLRPTGHFVFTVSHNSPSFRWHQPAPDSPRVEDRDGYIDDEFFVRRAGYQQWGDLKPVLGFHRPLRDYIAACKAVGLALEDLDEPEPSEEAQRVLSPWQLKHWRRAAFSYALRFRRP